MTPTQGILSRPHTYVVAIVDDVDAVRRSATSLLHSEGAIDPAIGNADSPFGDFPEKSDYVLLDLRMAGLDGRGVLRAIGHALPAGTPDDAKAANPEALARIAGLTRRQVQVLRGIVNGQLNKIIAHNLGLSVRTVETYRAQLLEKLGVRSTAAAVRLAMAAGLG